MQRPMRQRSAVAALFTVFVLALLSPRASAAEAASDVASRRPDLHDQWQPQTENDPRLQQPVHIEIIGRAAGPALKLLSEQTGVSLGVTPEDLETVGERKLTIIAQGCSLKALLVQIPRALQECHFDVDATGPQPIYLLHRDGSMETTMVRLAEEEPLRRQEEGRPGREAQVEAARKALGMSPEELAELEKTNLYLARSVKNPKSRFMLELFLSLPEEQMQQFINTGTAPMAYSSAPDHFRQSADKLLQDTRTEWAGKSGGSADLMLEIVNAVQGDISHATIQYEGNSDGGGYMRIFAFGKDGGRYSWGVEPALWAQYPSFVPEQWSRPLLLGSDTPDEKAADALAQEWKDKGDAERQRQKEEKQKAEWREPRSPELHKEVVAPFGKPIDPVEMQRFVAKETGLSLVSDYFTTWGPQEIPTEARESRPIWKLLYLLGEKWFWTYDWNEVGNCLVFHDRYWYRRVPQECPESLVTAYREKLATQGVLTLDDVASFTVELERCRPSDPRLRRTYPMIPRDLMTAGLSGALFSPEALLIYASLTPEQRAKARRAEGLPYAEMTRTQQALVRRLAGERRANGGAGEVIQASVSAAELDQAVYRIAQTRQTLGEPGPGDLLAAGTYDHISLNVEFPNSKLGTSVFLGRPEAAAGGGQQGPEGRAGK